MEKKKIVLSYILTAGALLLLFLWAANTGSLKVSAKQLFSGLFVAYDENVATIYDLRFPRIFIAMAGGAATAVSGVLLQAVMKNPLADPGIIGVSSGASLTAVLLTAFCPSLYFFTPAAAFLGGLAAFFLVYVLSWKDGLSPLRIILVGVAVNAMFMGLMSAFNSGTGSSYSGAASIVNANITMKTWTDFKMLIGYVVVGLIAAVVVSGQCDLLALEDKTARSIGVSVGKKPYGDFRDCGTACRDFNSRYRGNQLFGVNCSAYCKTAGGQQPQNARAVFSPAWCGRTASCGYSRKNDYRTV